MERIRGTPDFFLLFTTLALVGFGIVMVFSASSILSYWDTGNHWADARQQIISAGIGLILMLITMNLPYRFYQKSYLLFGAASIFLLFSVFIPGLGKEDTYGATRWIEIQGQSLQPSEFAKIGLIIYLAAVISRKEDRIRDFRFGLLPLIIVVTIFFGILILQNDFGTGAILIVTAGVVIICGGANLKHVLGLVLFSLPLLMMMIMMKPHRLQRITAFRDPWGDPLVSGYQLIQSLHAIAHGEITGVGLGMSIQKFHYLPFPSTDFIFSIIAEELGFIGVAILLLTYIAFLWRALIISLKTKVPFASLVGIGIVSMIATQIIINIGGVTGSMPITGVPLPLISKGGSSLMATMAAIGIILGISREVNRTAKLEQSK